MSLLEFAQRFATTEACLKHLEATRWADGEFCPHCGSERRIYHYRDGLRHKCADCRAVFRITAGTMFGDSPLKLLPKWFAAIYLVTEHRKGISSVQLARDIGVTQKTAWYMMHRIHKAAGKAFEEGKLLGPVEMDEACFGAPTARKKKGKRHGRKGYSEQDSTLLGMKERGGRVRAFRIERPTSATITPIIHRELAPAHGFTLTRAACITAPGESSPGIPLGTALMSGCAAKSIPRALRASGPHCAGHTTECITGGARSTPSATLTGPPSA